MARAVLLALGAAAAVVAALTACSPASTTATPRPAAAALGAPSRELVALRARGGRRPRKGSTLKEPPRGFGGAQQEAEHKVFEAEVVTDEELKEVESGPASPPPSTSWGSRDQLDMLLVGGGAVGLWLTVLLAAGLPGKVRVRVHDPRLELRNFRFHWREPVPEQEAAEVCRRAQPVVVPGHLWRRLPAEVRTRVFPPGGFVEQWPRTTADERVATQEQCGAPRTVTLGALEDSLLDVVQDDILAAAVELRPVAYDEDEHAKAKRSDPFDVAVLADGEAARRARDTTFASSGCQFTHYETTSAGRAGGTLGLFFDIGDADGFHAGRASSGLSMLADTALSLSQRRFLVSWTSRTRGLLQMRLTSDETKDLSRFATATDGPPVSNGHPALSVLDLSELQGSANDLWPRALEGLKLHALPVETVYAAARFCCENVDRRWYHYFFWGETRRGGVPWACLLGEAAQAGHKSFCPALGPGVGLQGAELLAQFLCGLDQHAENAGLNPTNVRTHQANMTRTLYDPEKESGMSVADRIAAGLETGGQLSDGSEHHEAYFSNLSWAVNSLCPERLPGDGSQRMPPAEDLYSRVLDAGLRPYTFGVLAASGPWRADVDHLDSTKKEDDADIVDLGGETPAGLERAAQLAIAGEAGDSEAQFELGVMYFTADGVNRDVASALQWLRRAAESGHAVSQNCVGSMLRNGVGCQVDKQQAADWFGRAAEQGFSEAQYNLGEMLYDGDGVSIDEVDGVRLLESAANVGLADAQYKLGVILHSRSSNEDQARAVLLMEQAAEQDLARASHMLGSLYYKGSGVPCDKVVAAKHYTRAAELGDAGAQMSIGLMLEFGDGIDMDRAQAQHWYRQAASLGLMEAQARCNQDNLLPAPSSS